MKKFSLSSLRLATFGMAAAFALSALFTATSCSDDEGTGDNATEEDSTYVPDELGSLQRSLVRIDSLGRFEERTLGVALDKTDTATVTVGVESLDEAKEIFYGLFADTTYVSPDTTVASFTTRAGSVTLRKADGTEGISGLIASADFSGIEGLKYVSTVHFILNAAWPANADDASRYKKGQIYKDKGWSTNTNKYATKVWEKFAIKRVWKSYTLPSFDPEEEFSYVCLTEAEKGKPALLLAITPTQYIPQNKYQKYGKNIPEYKIMKKIVKALRSDWNFFYNAFNIDGKHLLNDNEEYYYNYTSFWFSYSGACNLKANKYTDYKNENPLRILFYKEASK